MKNTNDAQGLVLGVVLVAVTLVIGIFILSQFGTTLQTTGLSDTVVNESGSIEQAGFQLTVSSADHLNPTNWVVLVAINASSNATIGLGNLTVSSTGLVTNATTTVWPDALLTYSYNYDADTEASTAAFSLVTGLASGVPWLTILIVVGFAVLVLGLLTGGFNRSNRGLPAY